MEFEVMRAKTYGPKKVDGWEDCRIEPKLDGIRVICLVEDGVARFFSRNGRLLDMFGHLDNEVRSVTRRLLSRSRGKEGYGTGVMFDGEMCGSTFNEIGGAIHRKNHTEKNAEYHVFHCMPLRLFGPERGDIAPQALRREHLDAAFRIACPTMVQMVDSVAVTAKDADREIRSLYRQFQKNGYEGAVVKNMAEPWVAKRTSAWLKMKASDTEDLPIIGWKPGKGKYDGTLGALFVQRGDVRVSVSGMDDKLRGELFKIRKKLESGRMVAEIEFQHVTAAGSLRHPRFVRLRKDKEK